MATLRIVREPPPAALHHDGLEQITPRHYHWRLEHVSLREKLNELLTMQTLRDSDWYGCDDDTLIRHVPTGALIAELLNRGVTTLL